VFLRADGLTSAVETNMRPGGMHIWDLAKRAFVDFDPWERWVSWAVEGPCETSTPVARGYCGIRLIRSPASGILRAAPDIEALARALHIELVEGQYSKRIGDAVTGLVKDNFSFIGQIVLFNEHYGQLSNDLLRLAEAIESGIEVSCLAPATRAAC
jgi:hypothetical protein